MSKENLDQFIQKVTDSEELQELQQLPNLISAIHVCLVETTL